MHKLIKFIKISPAILPKQINFVSVFKFAQTDKQIKPETEAKSDVTKKEIPVHLRPYDRNKYEVPSTKLKYSTGYAYLDVEPMPRAKIMKLCYIILDKLKKAQIPETALYRIYTEEKMKYIMKLTDEIEDVRRLEEELGFENVEIFIQALHEEVLLVDDMKEMKPWEMRDDEDYQESLSYVQTPYAQLKHMKYEKPEREKVKFIEK